MAVLLVTNGRETEMSYLSGLKRLVGRQISITTQFMDGDPMTVIRALQRASANLSEYEEVWVVVDHDGVDRSDFLAACRKLSTHRTTVHGVVSVPSFEVWLNAHYGRVKHYQDQAEASRHYQQLAGLPSRRPKSLPADFPWGSITAAMTQCYLPHAGVPDLDTQGPSPSTTMPHLIRSLGLA